MVVATPPTSCSQHPRLQQPVRGSGLSLRPDRPRRPI